jgi:hypothetical protein
MQYLSQILKQAIIEVVPKVCLALVTKGKTDKKSFICKKQTVPYIKSLCRSTEIKYAGKKLFAFNK